jgi:hypothetical protein
METAGEIFGSLLPSNGWNGLHAMGAEAVGLT